MQQRILICAVLALASLFAISEANPPPSIVTPGVFFGESYLGGAGSYPQVVYQPSGTPPTCDITNTCQTETYNIAAHGLAPFDEEVSFHLRGPLGLVRISIYQPVNGEFEMVSNWDPENGPTNMTFLMNAINDWSVCQGWTAMAYANPFGNASSAGPTSLASFLPPANEITIMSGQECNDDCGWYRGVGYHGWSGDKIFVIETSMPFSGVASDIPAIWSLNAEIPRTAQYGCNCWPDCGEFDISEVVQDGADVTYQTLYSYNGATQSAGYFQRPTDGPTTYVVHYSISDNRIYVVNIPSGCFTYPTILSQTAISALHTLATDINTILAAPNSNLLGSCPAGISASSPPNPATSAPTTQPPAPTQAPTTTTQHTAAAATTTNAPTTPAATTQPATTHSPTTKAASSTTNAPTAAPTTTQAAPTNPPSSNLCGVGCAACCDDMVLGPVCYDANLYVCASNKRLCPTGTDVCGTACYDLSMYGCAEGLIVLL